MPPPLILASTSRYRRALLERLGVPFSSEAPRCDEEALKQPGMAPQALAEFLAEAKAASVSALFPEAVVIGSDQLVALDEDVLGKPHTAPAAVAQLERLSGRSHRLITALVVAGPHGARRRHTNITILGMRRLDRATLTRYVEADQPLDCAGAYKLECRGIALFERIDSADQSAITGLPLMALTGMLRESGYAVP